MYTQKCSTERRGFGLKSTFQLVFKTEIKKIEQLAKNPQNYTVERNESFSFDQKPVEIDIFNNEEEDKIKKYGWKKKKETSRSGRKKEAYETTKKKAEREKEEEKELWSRLKTLNKDFKDVNENKNNQKKLSKPILN